MVGNYSSCIASAVQKDIILYDIMAQNQVKLSWTAHEEPVCQLRKNVFSSSLISGSWIGNIHLWDLKSKPASPYLKLLKHTRAVTNIEVMNEYNILSCSADASLLLWDIRSPAVPVNSLCPDGKSVLTAKIHPEKSLIAVSTLKVYAKFQQFD